MRAAAAVGKTLWIDADKVSGGARGGCRGGRGGGWPRGEKGKTENDDVEKKTIKEGVS